MFCFQDNEKELVEEADHFPVVVGRKSGRRTELAAMDVFSKRVLLTSAINGLVLVVFLQGAGPVQSILQALSLRVISKIEQLSS